MPIGCVKVRIRSGKISTLLEIATFLLNSRMSELCGIVRIEAGAKRTTDFFGKRKDEVLNKL